LDHDLVGAVFRMGVGGPCVVLRMEGGGGGAPLPPLIDGVGPEEAEEVGTGTGGSFLGDVEAEGGLIDDGNSKPSVVPQLRVWVRTDFLRRV